MLESDDRSTPAGINRRSRGLRCFSCETPHPIAELATVCRLCALPLRVDYDFAAPPPVSVLAGRPASLWRYAEALPIDPVHAVSLTEGWTPLLEVESSIYIKDESRNPTGSFKARGMALAVSMARSLGATGLRAPSAGNAAGALAAYGAAAGLPVTVAMPDDTPAAFVEECRHYGADVQLVPGTISDAGKHLKEHGPSDAFDVSTLREPYRIEGKKTLGYELWEQLGGTFPDVVVYPTGGGTGLIGMWKAWRELVELGWVPPEIRPPRMVAVQVETCAPVVRAFASGASITEPFPDPRTRAWGLRVPAPLGGFLCLRAIRETNGTALAVSEAAMASATRELAAQSGLDICPEGGAAWAALAELRDRRWLQPGEKVVVFNTGTGLKYR